MSLPLIVDVGIGLLFIYLILSLLASEIQELITTLFQWRAKHLREAIEILLAGESQTPVDANSTEKATVQIELDYAKQLANNLYHHPLLRSLNQEARGIIGRIGQLTSRLTNTTKIFSGDTSAPSYIPSGTFAATLLSVLKVEDLAQILSEVKLAKFMQEKLLNPVQEIVIDLRNSKANDRLLEPELQKLEANLQQIIQNFIDREITLTNSLQRTANSTQQFLRSAETVLPEDSLCKTCLKRLNVLHQEIQTLLQEAEPSLTEIISELKALRGIAQTMVRSRGDYSFALSQFRDEASRDRFQQGYATLQVMNDLMRQGSQGRETYEQVLLRLPPHVIDSLTTLAKQAQLRVEGVQQGVARLQQEVALWFDNAMDRTSGVYRRNAKGVAIILGFLIAIGTNTDTLNMINRLRTAPVLRETYGQAAQQLINANPETIVCLEGAQDRATRQNCINSGGVRRTVANLQDTLDASNSLPLGWSAENLREQWQPEKDGVFLSGLKLLIGWLVSAIAISMGAPFWFNLINRVVNVRNAGNPPPAKTEPNPSDSQV